jgi:hypothetical protein
MMHENGHREWAAPSRFKIADLEVEQIIVARGFIPVGQRSGPLHYFSWINLCRIYDCCAAERG